MLSIGSMIYDKRRLKNPVSITMRVSKGCIAGASALRSLSALIQFIAFFVGHDPFRRARWLWCS